MSLLRSVIKLNGSNKTITSYRFLSTVIRGTKFENARNSKVLFRHLRRADPNFTNNLLYACSRNFSVTKVTFDDEKTTGVIQEGSKSAEKYFIPEPPTPPDSPVEVSSDLLYNHLGEPTFDSLGIGTSYFPSDFILKLLEQLHVNVELPWWGVLGVATVIVRCALFPLIINYRKKSTNFTNHMPTVKKLQERMDTARLQNNLLEMSRVSKELTSFLERNDVVSMKSMFLFPVINIGVILSFLSAIRQMANYPIASMQEGGLFWFADLTLPDTYCLLPLTCVASMYVIMEVGADMTKVSAQSKGMKIFMRAFPAVVFFFMMNMPAAVTYYFTLSNFISVLQTKALRTEKLRHKFGIPDEVVHDPEIKKEKKEKKKGFLENFNETRRRSEMLRIVSERERFDDQQFRDAGKALVKKTKPLKQKSETNSKNVKELRRA